jgi:hypothetical protein
MEKKNGWVVMGDFRLGRFKGVCVSPVWRFEEIMMKNFLWAWGRGRVAGPEVCFDKWVRSNDIRECSNECGGVNAKCGKNMSLPILMFDAVFVVGW